MLSKQLRVPNALSSFRTLMHTAGIDNSRNFQKSFLSYQGSSVPLERFSFGKYSFGIIINALGHQKIKTCENTSDLLLHKGH